MDKIQIKEINDTRITFNDGSYIWYSHDQDCCENNYADFSSLDDLAKSYKYTLPLQFEKCGTGFRFGDKYRMYFVPCYSLQNGYYTDVVDIYYTTPTKKKKTNVQRVLSINCELIDDD